METTTKIAQWITPHILEMKAYTSARDTFQEDVDDVVLLDANENPYQWGYNRYPDPYQTDLRLYLAARYKLPTNCLMLGNGSDEVLDLLIRASCEPGKDQCMILPPTYGMYQVLGDLNQVDLVEVPLDDSFQPNVEAILSGASAKTKILFLCSPNNPTGNLMEAQRIEALLNGFYGLVVIDEAYIDFADAKSWVQRLGEFDNLVVVQTLSKAYGMAGLRLGMCYAHPDLIEVLLKIKPPYNINAATQSIAQQRLMDQQTLVDQRNRIIMAREQLYLQLSKISWVEKVYPSDANFLLIKVDNAKLRYAQAMERGFVLRNRHGMYGCDQCLRISIGTKDENNLLIEQLNQLK